MLKRRRSSAVGVVLSDFGQIAADLSHQFMIIIFFSLAMKYTYP